MTTATKTKSSTKKTSTKKAENSAPVNQAVDTTKKVDYAQLLKEALTGEGKLLEAYKLFHNFSFCNTILAMVQLKEVAPIKTYNQWLAIGRKVKAGEKAVALWMPVNKFKNNEQTGEKEQSGMFFVFKRQWFGYHQTELIAGQNDLYKEEACPVWDEKKALKELAIKKVKFAKVNGNVQGYASDGKIAINPMAQLPMKTMFHEMAHIVLEHTKESELLVDSEKITKDLKEVEAEATAMLCLASLDMDGMDYCRGYMQSWFKGKQEIPEKSCQRIISATNKILKAGMPKKEYNNNK